MSKRSWSVWLIALALAAATAACGGPETAAGGAGGTNGGKPGERPGTGGTGGGAGGSGGSGGAGGSGGEAFVVELDSVRPPRGARTGGDVLVLKGRGFADHGPIRVDVGANPSIGARVVDDETILAETPPGSAGEVDVTVTIGGSVASCAGCFVYLDALGLTAIEPATGSVYGGERVVLHGAGFSEGMTVTVGDRAALDAKAIDDSTLEALLPPGDEAGPVDVRVFDERGQAYLRKAFTYVAPLRIDSVEPPGGPLAGGNRFFVNGTGFDPTARIVLDGVELSTRFDSSERVSALAPAGAAAGALPLEVVTARGTVAAAYAYLAPCDGGGPKIFAVSPQRGSADGGDEITLAGMCLEDALPAVRLGGSLATDATADGATFVRAHTPPSSPGDVDVELRTTSGADVMPAGFRYVSLPTIASVSPSRGGVAGGTRIEVAGTGFPANVRVFVGALEATNVARTSDTLLTATTPRGTDGPVPVRIFDADDAEAGVFLAGAFRYEGPLSLAAVEPAIGSRAGGTQVTLRGAGFRDGMVVTFGAARALELSVLDPFTAIARSPRGNAGIVDVSVSRAGEPSAVRVGAFTYVDPGSTLGGASGGPIAGNLNVTVLDGGAASFGTPLAGATVSMGTEDGVDLHGITDDRGQVTISSPLLVKPQVVTVYLPGYEGASIVGQKSENLTVLLQRNAFPEGNPGGVPWVRTGAIVGRVWGFKLPPNRTLERGDKTVARLSYSAASVYDAPPFGYGTPEWTIDTEGGSFRIDVTESRQMAIYAVFGIVHGDGTFEKLSMGVTRNVNPVIDGQVTADVIIDTHLDAQAPVTVVNAPSMVGGGTQVFAFVDLGPEGVIPVASTPVTVSFGSVSGRLTGLPRLSADSFLFEAWGAKGIGLPLTVAFRRQAGALDAGITMGPLLGLTSITTWPGADGIVEWTREDGPTPEIVHAQIVTSQGFPVWHAVLPGTERRFAIPTSVLSTIRAQFPREQMRMTLVQGAEPRFDFGQWGYTDMGLNAYTSFTYDTFTFWL